MNFFGSEKYFNNRTPASVRKLEAEIDSRTPKDWFLALNNREYLKSRIIKQKMNIDEITLTSNMAIWAKKNKIETLYNAADANIINQNDYITVLDANNQKFMSYLSEKFTIFDAPLSNTASVRQYKNSGDLVIQDGILQRVGGNEDPDDEIMEKKKFSHMTAQDIQNMDVYDPTYDRDLYAQTIGLSMQRNRRNNLQKNMHKRHTDFDVDGLQSKEDECMVRKFDMSEFRRNANNSKKPISRFQFQ